MPTESGVTQGALAPACGDDPGAALVGGRAGVAVPPVEHAPPSAPTASRPASNRDARTEPDVKGLTLIGSTPPGFGLTLPGLPKTITECQCRWDDAACHEYLFASPWPEGLPLPRCGRLAVSGAAAPPAPAEYQTVRVDPRPVVVTWCTEPGSEVLAVVPHAAEVLQARSEAEMHEQVDTLLTHLYGTGGYEVVYRRVPPNSLGSELSWPVPADVTETRYWTMFSGSSVHLVLAPRPAGAKRPFLAANA